MNFKKYHVSRNLWSNRGFSATAIKLNYTHNISNNYGTTLSTTEGNEVTITQSAYPTGNSGYQNGFFCIDVDFSKYSIGDVVTISLDYIVNEIHALSTQNDTMVYAGKDQNIVPNTLSSGDWKVSGRLTATITVIADMRPYVEVRLCGNSITVKNIMLNEGSTALPYEPYSSEVWHDTPHYIHKTSTDTITTLPADIYPNAATATVGLKGNMSQSSQPSPTSPVMPQGTGNMTGNIVAAEDDRTSPMPGLSVVWKKGGSEMIINGKANGGDAARFATFELDAGTYTLSITGLDETGWNKTGFYLSGVDTARVQGVRTYTITEPTSARLQFVVNTSDITYENRKVTIMFTKTSTALPYEPYGYKIPISSANTTTPVYLGVVQSTRRIKKLVLTGTNADGEWKKSSTRIGSFYLTIGTNATVALGLCDRAVNVDTIEQYNSIGKMFVEASGSSKLINLWLFDTDISKADFKSYLATQYAAGTPVTVWYVLAEPTTGIVNEPIRKIGDYADEVSGITIPVTAGGDTISVDTTLQPSEVTVNYKGWHPVTDVHERENGAWT